MIIVLLKITIVISKKPLPLTVRGFLRQEHKWRWCKSTSRGFTYRIRTEYTPVELPAIARRSIRRLAIENLAISLPFKS